MESNTLIECKGDETGQSPDVLKKSKSEVPSSSASKGQRGKKLKTFKRIFSRKKEDSVINENIERNRHGENLEIDNEKESAPSKLENFRTVQESDYDNLSKEQLKQLNRQAKERLAELTRQKESFEKMEEEKKKVLYL